MTRPGPQLPGAERDVTHTKTGTVTARISESEAVRPGRQAQAAGPAAYPAGSLSLSLSRVLQPKYVLVDCIPDDRLRIGSEPSQNV